MKKVRDATYRLSESVAISFRPPKRIWHWKDREGLINIADVNQVATSPYLLVIGQFSSSATLTLF